MKLIKRTQNWDMFDLLTDFQKELGKAFSAPILTETVWGSGFHPVIDVLEKENHYELRADLPGLNKEDLKISAQGNMLTLSGERKQEKELKEKESYYSERSYGSFSRRIQFPCDIEANKVKARYQDGVLEVTLPKAESAKLKDINVEVK